MLLMESIRKIRLKYYRKGESIREIARDTGISRNTVRKVLRNDETNHKYQREAIHKPKIGAFEHILKEWLLAEEKLSKKERSNAVNIFERLQHEGYTGAYDSIQRYIKEFKRDLHPSLSNAFIPLSFAAGEAYQFDWSDEKVELGGIIQSIKVAHFRLSYSRKSFIAAYLRESQEMLFDAHIKAFEYFGGVLLRGIYDNLKTAIDFVFVGKERQFNRRFLELMSHYLIEPTACTPASGWEKGQVEKQVQNMRQGVFVPRLKADSLESLNAIIIQKVEEIETRRKHPEFGDKTIAEVFTEERTILQPLPIPFRGYIERESKVSSTCLVQVDRNRYSVECHYANCVVSVRIYADKIIVIAESKVIGEHRRLFSRDKVAYNPWHYVPLLERKPGGLRNGAPFRELALPQSIEQMRHKLLKKRGGDKDFVKILQAIPLHGIDAVLTACELALADEIIQGDYVLNVIGRLRPGILEVAIPLPVYFELREEPWSDCGRYNGLLGGQYA
jgi:transposase